MQNTINFKKDILNIFSDSVMCKNEDGNCVIGYGKTNYFFYDYNKLFLHGEKILLWMAQLGLLNSEFYFDDIKTDRNNNCWTDLNFYADLLLSMANALTLIEFKKDINNWDQNEKKNPQLVCSLFKRK